jgi:excisionase family DNA binding protein
MQLSLSIDEVSKATGIGRTKVYEAINRGLLPAKKYGKRTVILKNDLESFLLNLDNYLDQRKIPP